MFRLVIGETGPRNLVIRSSMVFFFSLLPLPFTMRPRDLREPFHEKKLPSGDTGLDRPPRSSPPFTIYVLDRRSFFPLRPAAISARGKRRPPRYPSRFSSFSLPSPPFARLSRRFFAPFSLMAGPWRLSPALFSLGFCADPLSLFPFSSFIQLYFRAARAMFYTFTNKPFREGVPFPPLKIFRFLRRRAFFAPD